MNLFETSYFYWCVSLAVLVPLSIITLNELIDRSRRGTRSYADVLSAIRDQVLPLAVVVIFLRFVFEVSSDNLPTRLLSTIFWLVLMVVIFRLTKKLIGSGQYSEDDWRSLVPHMFLRLPPYAVLGFIVFHIVQNLWSLPIREMATTLGIGSIVVAFALQDTLSNLVSGLLLVANSPFRTGDCVSVGDVDGRITAVNWRYTNIETWKGDLVVIPNGSIAGESIENRSRPNPVTAVLEQISISYEHAPNDVRKMFFEVFENTPGVLTSPEPKVYVVKVDDPVVVYEAEFWIKDYADLADIRDNFLTRLWYAMRRHDLSMPTPEYNIKTFDGLKNAEVAKQNYKNDRSKSLDLLPSFALLPEEDRRALTQAASYWPYAEDEVVIRLNAVEPGVFVIMSGSVDLFVHDEKGGRLKAGTLGAGEFFGEAGLFGRAVSAVTAITTSDTEVMVIPHELVSEIVNQYPRFAVDVNAIIEERRAVKDRGKHSDDAIVAQPLSSSETTEAVL